MSVRLPDPFTHEGAPGFASGDLVSNHPTIQDELTDGSVLQVDNGMQYWGINITYPDLFPEEYGLIISAIEEAKRLRAPIDIMLPQYVTFRVNGNTTSIGVPAGQKGSTLTLVGTDSLMGMPNPGDLVQLGNSTSKKVYRITSINLSIANQWTLGVYPDLQITTSGTEYPRFNDILFQTKMLNWNDVTSINPDGLYTGVSFSFRETK